MSATLDNLRQWLWKDGWTAYKRVCGFVPKTIFYKDETALLNPPKDVLFFQDFGVPLPLGSPKDREPREITWADIYEVRNLCFRWEHLRYTESGQLWFKAQQQFRNLEAEVRAIVVFLLDQGYCIPPGSDFAWARPDKQDCAKEKE